MKCKFQPVYSQEFAAVTLKVKRLYGIRGCERNATSKWKAVHIKANATFGIQRGVHPGEKSTLCDFQV